MTVVLRGIYGIVDRGLTGDPVALGAAMLAGGVGVLQYRAKAGVERAVVRELARRVEAAGAVLIVNDDFEAALEAGGWHAGQEDLDELGEGGLAPRERLGARIFGVSADDAATFARARALSADYVGVGPFAVTSTKPDAGRPIGAAGIADAVATSGLPVVAIGGIGAHNLAEVAATGCAMAAVASAIARSPDPEAAARALVERWAQLRP